MTIRFIVAWNGSSPGDIATLEGAEETRLVGLDIATTDLDGPDGSDELRDTEHLAEHERLIGWEDLRFPAQGINPAGQAAPPAVDTTTYPGTLLFDNASTDLIAGVAQMPHAWSRGTEVHPHIHWSKTTSAAGGVVWEWCYAVADIGGTFGAYSAWAAATERVADSNTAEKQALHAFPVLSMTGYKESTMIAWQVRRKHDDVGDTYAAAARMWEFDIHYQATKFGTNPEIPV